MCLWLSLINMFHWQSLHSIGLLCGVKGHFIPAHVQMPQAVVVGICTPSNRPSKPCALMR